MTPEPAPIPAPTAGVEYARRMYDRVIDWYKVAESKAQLILTVNGVFVSVAFGVSAGASALLTSRTDAFQRCADAFDVQNVFQRANFTRVDV